MRALPDYRIGLLAAPLILLLLHAIIHQYTISFVILPFAIAGILPYLFPKSLVALLTLTIGSELLSSTRPGVMITAILVPFIVRRLIQDIEPSFNLKFFGLTFLITATQFFLLTSSLAFELFQLDHIMLSNIWTALPLSQILASLATTTLILFIVIGSWFEWFAPANNSPRGSIKPLSV